MDLVVAGDSLNLNSNAKPRCVPAEESLDKILTPRVTSGVIRREE